MFKIKSRQSGVNTEKWLKNIPNKNMKIILEKYAKLGVIELSRATAKDSGETSRSWSYVVTINKTYYNIVWTNSNIQNGIPIAIILQYGHGTKNGGFVQGIDYINPALRLIMDSLADELWREMMR